MSQHHHAGGATGIGTRAVVVRGGPTLRTERRTVVDETDRTVTVDDGTRFVKATGLERHAPEPGTGEHENAWTPTRLVTEGHPEFEQLWADAGLSAFTDSDHAAYVEGLIASNRLARRGDVHAHYDVAAIIDELAALHPDLEAVPEDLFWAVVDRHAREEDRDDAP
ncbi:hypothetical protein [uncultured Kocuria sp.]|uniref:hypothetical protein n=1 Tax=uncultured Kocuria sp. TaxID=259305 RepID=UPI00262EB6D6|nr:hypothetical protein [uncultured Kocuria sp.]